MLKIWDKVRVAWADNNVETADTSSSSTSTSNNSTSTGRSGGDRTVYDELKPILSFVRLFGFAPFIVTRDKRATPSKLFLLQNALIASVALYYGYRSEEAADGRKARSPLSVIFFRIIEVTQVVYTVVCLVHFIVKTKVSIKVWTFIQDINDILNGIDVRMDLEKTKRWNYLTSAVFLVVFGCFATLYTTTMNEPPSVGFAVIFFLPLFNNYLLIFYFTMLTTNLKRKCQLMNEIFQEEIEMYRNNVTDGTVTTDHYIRHQYYYNYYGNYHYNGTAIGRNNNNKSGFGSFTKAKDFSDESRTKAFPLLRKVRALKLAHLKMYKAVKNLNRLFGFHFLYIFIIYFCLGSLHSFTIIRHISEYTSRVLFLESVYAITMETVQITFAVYGSIILEKEVRKTIMAVQKFLTMTNEGDINLENELQSFSIQLHQCGVNFTASGFFSVDYTMLFQFAVAYFSNAVFFLQVDTMNNARNQ